MKAYNKKNINTKTFPKMLFIFSLCILSFGSGFIAYHFKWFPYSLIKDAVSIYKNKTIEYEIQWYYVETDHTTNVPVYDKSSAYNGLSLVTSVIENDMLSARVINMDGELIHGWDIDWFNLWPDATHIPKSEIDYPKSRPGTNIHGALLLNNGDLIFNFTNLGMVRLDVCGDVIWRFPYRTHHSIHLDEYGNLWVPGMIFHDELIPEFPNYIPRFIEFTILKVSLDGKLLKEISLFDVIKENDLQGLLNLSSLDNRFINVSGDTLHLNDVEIFPSYMDEGVFKAGDIMVSLRNINTILIFREKDLKVTYVSTGTFVRQHDPDFIDGNTISVFDNYNIAPEDYGHQSRILIMSIEDSEYDTYYSGNEQHPFYSDFMGNHQWLTNGNLLITESVKGRAIEIDPQGNIVWEFINIVGDGYAGIVTDVQRLSDLFTEKYFDQLTKRCSAEYSD